MGCASSAALPFLTGRGSQTVSESANGKPPYELNSKLMGDAANGVKDINEALVTDSVKDAADSSAVQGVIGGVINTKDEIINQVQGAGEAVANKVSSVVEDIGEGVESTLSQITHKIEDVEEKVKSEVKGVGDKISSMLGSAEDEAKEKNDEIDELLAALPDEDEIAAQSKATAEELIEMAKEELTEDEMKN